LLPLVSDIADLLLPPTMMPASRTILASCCLVVNGKD
jgi:hypothetical protein